MIDKIWKKIQNYQKISSRFLGIHRHFLEYLFQDSGEFPEHFLASLVISRWRQSIHRSYKWAIIEWDLGQQEHDYMLEYPIYVFVCVQYIYQSYVYIILYTCYVAKYTAIEIFIQVQIKPMKIYNSFLCSYNNKVYHNKSQSLCTFLCGCIVLCHSHLGMGHASNAHVIEFTIYYPIYTYLLMTVNKKIQMSGTNKSKKKHHSKQNRMFILFSYSKCQNDNKLND